jgi:hypothetical protein
MFTLYAFDIIKFYSFTTILGQTLSSLTLTKPRMQSNLKRKEYNLRNNQITPSDRVYGSCVYL